MSTQKMNVPFQNEMIKIPTPFYEIIEMKNIKKYARELQELSNGKNGGI